MLVGLCLSLAPAAMLGACAASDDDAGLRSSAGPQPEPPGGGDGDLFGNGGETAGPGLEPPGSNTGGAAGSSGAPSNVDDPRADGMPPSELPDGVDDADRGALPGPVTPARAGDLRGTPDGGVPDDWREALGDAEADSDGGV